MSGSIIASQATAGPAKELTLRVVLLGITLAVVNGIKIIRHRRHVREVIPVPVDDIIKNGEVEKDLWLMPGDTILVP